MEPVRTRRQVKPNRNYSDFIVSPSARIRVREVVKKPFIDIPMECTEESESLVNDPSLADESNGSLSDKGDVLTAAECNMDLDLPSDVKPRIKEDPGVQESLSSVKSELCTDVKTDMLGDVKSEESSEIKTDISNYSKEEKFLDDDETSSKFSDEISQTTSLGTTSPLTIERDSSPGLLAGKTRSENLHDILIDSMLRTARHVLSSENEVCVEKDSELFDKLEFAIGRDRTRKMFFHLACWAASGIGSICHANDSCVLNDRISAFKDLQRRFRGQKKYTMFPLRNRNEQQNAYEPNDEKYVLLHTFDAKSDFYVKSFVDFIILNDTSLSRISLQTNKTPLRTRSNVVLDPYAHPSSVPIESPLPDLPITAACGKSFCNLGCVCISLRTGFRFRIDSCGRNECIFECTCGRKRPQRKVRRPGRVYSGDTFRCYSSKWSVKEMNAMAKEKTPITKQISIMAGSASIESEDSCEEELPPKKSLVETPRSSLRSSTRRQKAIVERESVSRKRRKPNASSTIKPTPRPLLSTKKLPMRRFRDDHPYTIKRKSPKKSPEGKQRTLPQRRTRSTVQPASDDDKTMRCARVDSTDIMSGCARCEPINPKYFVQANLRNEVAAREAVQEFEANLQSNEQLGSSSSCTATRVVEESGYKYGNRRVEILSACEWRGEKSAFAIASIIGQHVFMRHKRTVRLLRCANDDYLVVEVFGSPKDSIITVIIRSADDLKKENSAYLRNAEVFEQLSSDESTVSEFPSDFSENESIKSVDVVCNEGELEETSSEDEVSPHFAIASRSDSELNQASGPRSSSGIRRYSKYPPVHILPKSAYRAGRNAHILRNNIESIVHAKHLEAITKVRTHLQDSPNAVMLQKLMPQIVESLKSQTSSSSSRQQNSLDRARARSAAHRYASKCSSKKPKVCSSPDEDIAEDATTSEPLPECFEADINKLSNGYSHMKYVRPNFVPLPNSTSAINTNSTTWSSDGSSSAYLKPIVTSFKVVDATTRKLFRKVSPQRDSPS